jgi:hypothetical protein
VEADALAESGLVATDDQTVPEAQTVSDVARTCEEASMGEVASNRDDAAMEKLPAEEAAEAACGDPSLQPPSEHTPTQHASAGQEPPVAIGPFSEQCTASQPQALSQTEDRASEIQCEQNADIQSADTPDGPLATSPEVTAKVATLISNDPEERQRQEQMAARIQRAARGRSVRTKAARAAKHPLPGKKAIPKTTDDSGCIHWVVALHQRADNVKYGFSHSNGRAEFEKERGNPPDEVGPECLFVRKVKQGGLLDEWNKEHPDGEVVMGDRILDVNGNRTADSMQAATSADGHLTLHVVRYPATWNVLLQKRDDKKRLGFKFDHPPNCGLPELRVTEVGTEGLLEEWNASHASQGLHHLCVLPGMRVEKANEKQGSAALLAQELMKCQVVNLVVRRMDVASAAKQKLMQKMALLQMFGPSPSSMIGTTQAAAADRAAVQ